MLQHLQRVSAAIAFGQADTRHLGSALSFLFVLSLIPTLVKGQSDTPHAYVAQITGLITELDEKLVYEAVNGWAPIEDFELSRSAHRLKFTAIQPVGEGELTERLAGTGTTVFWLAEVQADGTLVGDSYVLHAFPVFQDTGDPAADNARYDADKASWMAAHPGWVDVNTLWDRERGTANDILR